MTRVFVSFPCHPWERQLLGACAERKLRAQPRDPRLGKIDVLESEMREGVIVDPWAQLLRNCSRDDLFRGQEVVHA